MDYKFRVLRADEIECRISQINKAYITLLLYKDARVDQNILDETVKPMNWQRHHNRDNANCIVSIWDEDKKQWIEKEDTGKESYTEAEKGLASDSFKRACFNWGIGRELYTAPRIQFKRDKANVTADNKCYDHFSVERINYDESRNITELSIINDTTGNRVFDMKEEPVDIKATNRATDASGNAYDYSNVPASEEIAKEPCTEKQARYIENLIVKKAMSQEQILNGYKVKSVAELSKSQAKALIDYLTR